MTLGLRSEFTQGDRMFRMKVGPVVMVTVGMESRSGLGRSHRKRPVVMVRFRAEPQEEASSHGQV